MRDPYEVLGISKTAGEAEIKKAFRNLAKKHHPDTHAGDAGAKKRFQEISAAYDIVGDKDKRVKFDRGEIDAGGNPRGFDPRQGGFGQGGARPGGGFTGNPFGQGAGDGREFHFTWDDAAGGGGGGAFSAEDIFADLLGGRGKRARAGSRGEDFSAAVTVSFEEAANGGTRRVVLPNGEQIDVKIPPGLKDGQQIRVKGRGGAGKGSGAAGDILIQVTVAPHPWLTRDGNDLRMDLPVTLKEAVLGAKVPVPTLTGTVSLTVPPGSNTGTVLRLKGKGIQAMAGAENLAGNLAGNLYVRLVVQLPDEPDAELQRFASGWKTDYDPRAKLR